MTEGTHGAPGLLEWSLGTSGRVDAHTYGLFDQWPSEAPCQTSAPQHTVPSAVRAIVLCPDPAGGSAADTHNSGTCPWPKKAVLPKVCTLSRESQHPKRSVRLQSSGVLPRFGTTVKGAPPELPVGWGLHSSFSLCPTPPSPPTHIVPQSTPQDDLRVSGCVPGTFL